MTPQAPAPHPTPRPRPDVLLDQQLWFLGRDIAHGDGNALTRFGFQRVRAVASAGSAYVLPLDEDTALVCVGFGVYLGPVCGRADEPLALSVPWDTPDDGARPGVLWRRHRRSPQLTRAPLTLPLRGLQDLPDVVTAPDHGERTLLQARLRTLAAAFARYEAWALTTLGPQHRGRALAALPRHKRVRLRALVPALTGAWDQLPM